MARGSSYGDQPPSSSQAMTAPTNIPRRATRQLLPPPQTEELEPVIPAVSVTRAQRVPRLSPEPYKERPKEPPVVYYPSRPHPLARYRSRLTILLVSLSCVVICSLILISAGIFMRNPTSQNVPYNASSFPISLGGSYNSYTLWENSNGPIPSRTALPKITGPYSVLGKPTITASFINTVLANYNSPTAGMGKSLYDLGVKYGIDPVYPLAFFMHESLFGTTGEARVTMSLGNSRCIQDRPCIDQDRGGYAQMYSWEDGFEQWYKLIRNLYIAQWGRVTIDQIIPKYAPNSDGNNEAVYIATLKHEIDEWRSGIVRV